MNYRFLYEKSLNIRLNDSFDVHHIDLDRNNNSLKNLVAIPIDLHKEYHSLRKYLAFSSLNDVGSLIDVSRAYNDLCISNLVKLNNCISCINEYIDYRDFLIGDLPMVYQGSKFY